MVSAPDVTAFTKECVLVFTENALIDSRPHYRSDAFSTVHTRTFKKDRITRCGRKLNSRDATNAGAYNILG